MPTSEALIVTALGMTVVFIGLLLCIAFIVMFGRVAKHVTWGEGGHGHGHGAPAPAPASPAGCVIAVVSIVRLPSSETAAEGRRGSYHPRCRV